MTAVRRATLAPACIVFAPHPDDEVIACGGTILARRAGGWRVQIVFATDGAQSHQAVLGIGEDPSPADLVVLRRAEALAAAALLGVAAHEVSFAGAPDTRLCDALDRLRAHVDAVLAECARLDEVYIPHERRELNADHRLTGQVVLERLARTSLRPRVYKYVVWDESTESQFGYRNRIGEAAALAPDEAVWSEPITPFIAAKRAALLAHRSQTSLIGGTQTRPVIPPAFLERVCAAASEQFWLHPPI